MAGLSIDKKRDFHAIRWLFIGIVVILLLIVAYYAYEWYAYGNKPPLVALPASAYADSSVDESAVTQNDIRDYKVPVAYPRYLSIPALGVAESRIETVGLTKLSALTLPHNISDAAWYKNSATPGQGYGQVVIDGYNVGVTRNGVFHGLDGLHKGDKVIITRGDGKKFTYDIVKKVTLPINQANAAGLQQLTQPYDSTKEGLGILTTAGKWIPRDKVFSDRILVWAVAEQ